MKELLPYWRIYLACGSLLSLSISKLCGRVGLYSMEFFYEPTPPPPRLRMSCLKVCRTHTHIYQNGSHHQKSNTSLLDMMSSLDNPKRGEVVIQPPLTLLRPTYVTWLSVAGQIDPTLVSVGLTFSNPWRFGARLNYVSHSSFNFFHMKVFPTKIMRVSL